MNGQRCHAQDSNPRPVDLESGTLCTTPQKQTDEDEHDDEDEFEDEDEDGDEE